MIVNELHLLVEKVNFYQTIKSCMDEEKDVVAIKHLDNCLINIKSKLRNEFIKTTDFKKGMEGPKNEKFQEIIELTKLIDELKMKRNSGLVVEGSTTISLKVAIGELEGHLALLKT